MVNICLECFEFLTNPDDKVGRSFGNVWPEFLWNTLTDRNILNVYGDHIWKFVPIKWRYWWIEAVHELDMLAEVSIEHPYPLFQDITNDIGDMKRCLQENTLSAIMRCCNTHLIPSVLCPWGESEYIHKCGVFSYDALLQRHLPKCYIQKHSTDKVCDSIYSSREDYIRDNVDEYDELLLNPSWKVLPSIAFIEGKGPHILTCRNHDGGCKKSYIHPPRQPNHILPSRQGDQLCHAVIKPCLIHPMRASKYSNIYQMHEQRGSFQGVDTCDVTNFGDFSFCSVLLDDSELRTIKHRPDINALLDSLEKRWLSF